MDETPYTFKVRIEHLPEGPYLATSDDLPGLVAQGRTVDEALELAHDVARKLIESYREHGDPIPASLKPLDSFTLLDVAVGV
ncbi:MAG: type II toxin-antitoxin system HicB family antitoxin [Spirochaetales bacterium]